jgi:hypothetical protein
MEITFGNVANTFGYTVVTYYLCRKLLQVSEYGPGGSGGCTFETKLILVQFVDGQNVE